MSDWTSLTLIYHDGDRKVAAAMVPVADANDDGRRGRFVEAEPENCVLQFRLASAAIKRIAVTDEIVAAIQAAPWRAPESLLLLVQDEDEIRPAVWGFAGARCFGRVDKPWRFVCLVPAVPS